MSGRGKSAKSLALIEAARDILAEIQPATVRAVCYRLFVLKVILDMSKKSTNRVSVQLRDAREQGQIPWSWIVDETREAETVNAWRDPAAYCDVVKRSYRRDRWADQPCRVELWSEKGTVRGTLANILDTYGITFRVMHGYGSATTIHEVAADSLSDQRQLTALYVGDWDPSGLHMSEIDLPGRLAAYGGDVDVQRIALSDEDVADGSLPSFGADSKRGDPRYQWYLGRHGHRCWELDAMSPVALRERVEDAILDRIEWSSWQRADVAERAELESLTTILKRWPAKAAASICRQASK